MNIPNLTKERKEHFKIAVPPERFANWVVDVGGPVCPALDDELTTWVRIDKFANFCEEEWIILLAMKPELIFQLQDSDADPCALEFIFSLIEKANLYGVSLPHPDFRYEGYEHESGLDKEFLLEYFPSDGLSIFMFVWSLMTLSKLQASGDFIIGVWTRIDDNPEDIKDQLFLNAPTVLLDDEEFIRDCLNAGIDNYGHPLCYSSERVQKIFGVEDQDRVDH